MWKKRGINNDFKNRMEKSYGGNLFNCISWNSNVWIWT